MLVADDAIRLMGFADADERDWFRLLTSVQGVGAPVALAIPPTPAPAALPAAIAKGVKAMVFRAYGLAPTLAHPIVNDVTAHAARHVFAAAYGLAASLMSWL